MFGMSEGYGVSVVTGVEKYSVYCCDVFLCGRFILMIKCSANGPSAILLNLVVVDRTHNKLSKCQSLVLSFRDTGLPIHTDASYYLR